MKIHNLEKINELLKDIYNLTNIKSCLYDIDGNELFFYPERLTDFCAYLRTNPEMNKKCIDCDKKAVAQCKKTHTQCFYTCHAGLKECVSPIIFDNTIIGFITIGQIKEQENFDFETIKNNFPTKMQKTLQEKFAKLPHIPIEKVNSAIRIMDACAGYEHLKRLINEEENRIDKRIEKFINSNLSGDLSVTLLCSEFRLARSEVYSIFKEYFSSSPAEFIKNRRLNYAGKLLLSTDFPVYKVALLCGIADYNYFSKNFKSFFGVNPTEYKKLHKK